MASYVKFELEDGTIVYIETTESPRGSSGLIPAGKGDHAAEQANLSFDKSVETIQKMAAVMIGSMREGYTEPPSEISVNFGLKASADLGTLIVSRGGMEANFNVALRWHKDKDNGKGEKEPEEAKEEKK